MQPQICRVQPSCIKRRKRLDIIQVKEYTVYVKYCRKVEAMNFMTTKQAAESWGVSPRRVAVFCEQGRVPGAVKAGKTWLLPPNTEKPADARKKSSHDKK